VLGLGPADFEASTTAVAKDGRLVSFDEIPLM